MVRLVIVSVPECGDLQAGTDAAGRQAERRLFVFEIGEYVVCGNKGVCVVEDVTKLNISDVDKEREYYILKPLYMAGSTVYVPVDSSEKSMRRVLKRATRHRS